MPKAVYRSALRSKRLLREAFSQLLREKDYRRITVSEVVQRADLNRSTFYAHYTCIEDLIRELATEVTDGLFSVLQSALTGDFLHHPEPTLELLGNGLQQERSLYCSLIEAQQADLFMEDLRKVLSQRILEELEGLKEQDSLELTAFLAGGVLTLYRAWLEGTLGETDVEEVNARAAAYVKAIGAAQA